VYAHQVPEPCEVLWRESEGVQREAEADEVREVQPHHAQSGLRNRQVRQAVLLPVKLPLHSLQQLTTQAVNQT
jgi:hypothetical protein